jgi:hypothetical protein
VTDSSPTPPSPRERVDSALRRVGAFLETAFAAMRRRRVTLIDRKGTVWATMPMTVGVVVLALAVVYALPLVVILALVGFALGAQLSVTKVAPPAPAQEVAPHDEPRHP